MSNREQKKIKIKNKYFQKIYFKEKVFSFNKNNFFKCIFRGNPCVENNGKNLVCLLRFVLSDIFSSGIHTFKADSCLTDHSFFLFPVP